MSAPLLETALARHDRESTAGTFTTGRYRCRYRVWGSGPPLVLVHGLSDMARSFAPLMALLSDRFRCVCYDLPDGRGDGARLGRYTHADHVADLFALLDHLKIGPAVLVGSSFGSTVALEALRQAPERFPVGVLQGGFARRPLTRFETSLARLGSLFPGRMHHIPVRRLLLEKIDRPAFAEAEAGMYDFFKACSGHTPIRAAAKRGLILRGVDLRPALSAIRRPVLMIGGDNDAIVPRWCEAEVEKGLPDVRRIEFARCGHYPQYTHPNLTADAVVSFVRDAGADF